MLNVICAISTVLNPREMPNAINASIREIPVTISEFSSVMLLIPMTMVRGIRFMLLMPMAAIVPMTVAIMNALNNTLLIAFASALIATVIGTIAAIGIKMCIRDR